MRRWLIRISLGLAILIVLAILVVQIVLWTSLPKRIVMQQIEQQLGLRISADSLRTGWLGKTVLENVSLGLPLSDRDFLKVKRLTIQHNTLIGLALGHTPEVQRIEIDDPVLEVEQDATGAWNLQQAALLLARAAGANAAKSEVNKGVPKLPNLRLSNGNIHVADNQHHMLDLQPLNVTGQDQGSLVWKYDATMGDAIAAHGEVAPGGNWQHRVTVTAQNLDTLLKGWGVPTTYSANIKANWTGQTDGAKVTGALTIEQATAKAVPTLGDVAVGGAVEVEAGDGIQLHPNNLKITSTYVTLPNLGIQSGTIAVDRAGVRAKDVRLAALGGVASVDGAFDPKTMAADLSARWSGLSLASQTSRSGSLKASLRQPFAGQPVIHAELDTSGGGTAGRDTAGNHWNAQMALDGQGSSWKNIDWVLNAPQLAYTSGEKTFDLSKVSARVTQRLPVITLTDLSLPADSGPHRANSAKLVSSGSVDFSSSLWHFDATGGWEAWYDNAPVPIALTLHASGDQNAAVLKQLAIVMADLSLTADGSYDTKKPTQPVALHVKLGQSPRLSPDSPVQGTLSGDFNIVGVLFTTDGHLRPYLTTTGNLTGSNLVVFNHALDDVVIKLQGTTDAPKIGKDEYGIHTKIQTTDFVLFQAPWQFSADYPDHDGKLNLSLETRRLPLAELGKVMKVKGLSGQLADAKWIASVSSAGADGVDLHSEYHLEKPGFGALDADSIDVTATLHRGVLAIDPIRAKRGDGTITSTASLDLRDPHSVLNTQVKIDRWPVPISSSVLASISSDSQLNFDFRVNPPTATGSLSLATDVTMLKTPLAHAEVAVNIAKRVIDAKVSGKVGGGTFEGTAGGDLDKPLQASGRIAGSGIDGATLATVIPALGGLGGTYSWAVSFSPARDPRPLAPVRMDVNLAAVNGHYRSVKIGDAHLLALHSVAYLDLDRAVLDPNYSVFYVAGGAVRFWGRVDNRGGRGLSALATFDVQDLQLNQIAHVDPEMASDMPGLINGQVAMVRSGTSINQLLGTGHLALTECDLVRFGPLASLYAIMNAGGGVSKAPNGSGSVDLALEQNKLRVNSFRFFNRGIDARALFDVGPLNYADFRKTPIGGQVVGTARALKGTRVALLSDFDAVYAALAGQLTTVDVSQTIGNPKYQQATLSDIGNAMRQLLVGDVAKGNAQ